MTYTCLQLRGIGTSHPDWIQVGMIGNVEVEQVRHFCPDLEQAPGLGTIFDQTGFKG